MDLIGLSLRRPVFAWMLMTGLIVFGAISLNRLGISQMPDVDFPVLSINITNEGAAPEVIEAELLDEIEQKLLNIEGIKEMRSKASQGAGSITLDFDISRDIDLALQEVQSALSQVKLPQGVDLPVLRKRNPEEQPIMYIGLAADKPLRELLIFADDFLLDQFRFIDGVGEVALGGFSERTLRIWPDLSKLKKAQLTILDLTDAIDSQHLETTAGEYLEGSEEIRVRWRGEAASVDEIKALPILRRGGQLIQDVKYTLGDFALVEDGLSDITRLARSNGKNAVAFGVRKQRGGNEVVLANLIKQKIKDLQVTLPEGYKLQLNVDFTRPTEAVVASTTHKLWLAALITILVCLLFLASWQSALNILFSIPTSILGTFIIIYYAGFTLNIFTLLALTLVISIVVDDAIMILENITRHFHMGKNPFNAAYDGAKEILPAAVASSLAVVAIFIPTVFMDGVTGKFFYQFGITMSAAVLLSLVEAVTITPMRAHAFLGASGKTSQIELKVERFFYGLSQFYSRFLHHFLRWPAMTVFVGFVFFASSLLVLNGLKREFVPSQDQNILIISGSLPPGTSLQKTDSVVLKIEEIIKENPLVESYFVSVGAGGPSGESNQFFIPLYLKPRQERTQDHLQIMADMRKKLRPITEARISLRDISARNITSGKIQPVAFNIRGPNLDILQKKSDEIMNHLNDAGLTVDMDTDFKLGVKELELRPDREAMKKYGVNASAIGKTLSAALASLRINKITFDGRRYDMRIKIRDELVGTPEDITSIYVRNNFGNLISLDKLVTIEKQQTFQSITRINRQRSVGVFGNLAPGQSQASVLQKAREFAESILPSGYVFSLEGAAAGLNESFNSMMLAFIIGIIIAYMILGVQFNSFVHPIAILMALPFSISGALFALYLMDTSLNLYSMIGIIVLMGIAKKNSILLIEFTNQIRSRSPTQSIKDSLLFACPIRLRPILMTSIATIAAAVPLVLGNEVGQEVRAPMGWTIIGGNLVSTAFTLVVVPCFYLLMTKFERKPHNQ